MQNCTGVGVLRWHPQEDRTLLLRPLEEEEDVPAAAPEPLPECEAPPPFPCGPPAALEEFLEECRRSRSPLTSSSPELPFEPARITKC